MVTDQQVALLRQRQMEGKKQQTAAAMAGMSERSARKWQCGPLPSETKTERRWRTRPDPFDGVWEEEILPLLQGEAAGRLRATTIIEWLEEKSPGRFSASQLRTLQRRLQDWRALNGPDQEVYFPQEHPPGREAQLDFTHCNSLGVTIGGRRYRHLLFQLVLSHSGWRYAEVVAGETFVALKQGLQNALWELGGAPQVIRSDNSSALTHEIKRSRGRALNDNYAELLEHYVPLALRQQLGELSDGSFVDRGVNVLAFGLPGTGKTHALCALGHRLVEAGRSVLFAPAYRLVQDLLAAKRDLALPRQLRKLDNYDFLLLDDLGYLPQGAEESEVLFTLIAERYERRSLGITSNLVFSQWEHIFANPMATAAAIDRVVHHSVILEFDVPSYRTGVAQQRSQKQGVNRQE